MGISICGWQKEWRGPWCLKGILVSSQRGVELILSQQTDNLAVRPAAKTYSMGTFFSFFCNDYIFSSRNNTELLKWSAVLTSVGHQVLASVCKFSKNTLSLVGLATATDSFFWKLFKLLHLSPAFFLSFFFFILFYIRFTVVIPCLLLLIFHFLPIMLELQGWTKFLPGSRNLEHCTMYNVGSVQCHELGCDDILFISQLQIQGPRSTLALEKAR